MSQDECQATYTPTSNASTDPPVARTLEQGNKMFLTGIIAAAMDYSLPSDTSTAILLPLPVTPFPCDYSPSYATPTNSYCPRSSTKRNIQLHTTIPTGSAVPIEHLGPPPWQPAAHSTPPPLHLRCAADSAPPLGSTQTLDSPLPVQSLPTPTKLQLFASSDLLRLVSPSASPETCRHSWLPPARPSPLRCASLEPVSTWRSSRASSGGGDDLWQP